MVENEETSGPITEKPVADVPKPKRAPRVLTKSDFIGAPDAGFVYEPIPEWRQPGDTDDPQVKIRGLTARERGQIEDFLDKNGMAGVRARLAVMSCVNEDGSAMFTQDDEAWLNEKAAAPLDRIYMRSARHSKLGKTDLVAEVGNSGGAR
jgi:hypothetical protein